MYNAFSACDLRRYDWSASYDPTSYCSRYSITWKGRTKYIAKSSKSSYIQVHSICGIPVVVNATDMIMYHQKQNQCVSGNSTIAISKRMKRLLHKAHTLDHSSRVYYSHTDKQTNKMLTENLQACFSLKGPHPSPVRLS